LLAFGDLLDLEFEESGDGDGDADAKTKTEERRSGARRSFMLDV
jgi:hypothetical protein